MRTVAIILADLEQTPLGTKSRLADAMHGEPVLRRTIGRLEASKNLSTIVVASPPNQADMVRSILDGTTAVVESVDAPPPPYHRLVCVARKWSLDSWRGGLGGSCAFDEYTHSTVHTALCEKHNAEAVAIAAPGSVLIDPELLDAMIEHHVANVDDARLTFAQAPPGLTAMIIQPGVLEEIAKQSAPPGWGLAYKPDAPGIDVAFRSCCFAAPQSVRHASGRLTADTTRSMRTLNAILAENKNPTVEQIAGWLHHRAGNAIEPLPQEVEIELTTDDPLPKTRLRLRGSRVPERGPLSIEWVKSVARELSGDADDALVVLGGHGDPLCHVQFPTVLRELRSAGVYGICVYTTGQSVSQQALDALIEYQVDVVAVHVDAQSPETYQSLNGSELAGVHQFINRLVSARADAQQPAPIVIPQMTKCIDNVEEMDVFFDEWVRRTGCATITGYCDYAGALPDLAVTDASPPQRKACRRLWRRCVILSDGSIVACDQDAAGAMRLGHLRDTTLSQAWCGPAASRLRHSHLTLSLNEMPMCENCRQWFRR